MDGGPLPQGQPHQVPHQSAPPRSLGEDIQQQYHVSIGTGYAPRLC